MLQATGWQRVRYGDVAERRLASSSRCCRLLGPARSPPRRARPGGRERGRTVGAGSLPWSPHPRGLFPGSSPAPFRPSLPRGPSSPASLLAQHPRCLVGWRRLCCPGCRVLGSLDGAWPVSWVSSGPSCALDSPSVPPLSVGIGPRKTRLPAAPSPLVGFLRAPERGSPGSALVFCDIVPGN